MPMNRQRSLPSVDFTDPRIAKLHPAVRITAAGMRLFADDEGRGLVRLRPMLAEIFEHDEEMTETHLEECLLHLDAAQWLRLYTADGLSLFQIRIWPSVQHASPSSFPPPPGFMKPSRRSQETFMVVARESASESARGGESELRAASGPAWLAPEPDFEPRPPELEPPGPSPFCSQHQPYGTEDSCGPCRTTRMAFEIWHESKQRRSLSTPASPSGPRPRTATGPRFEPVPDANQLDGDNGDNDLWHTPF